MAVSLSQQRHKMAPSIHILTRLDADAA